jgi:secondary thiamine-phosphate synthase enzyme
MMKLTKTSFTFHSKGFCSVTDITTEVAGLLSDTGLTDGVVNLYADPGSTAAISTLEYEPNLVRDVSETMERLVPFDAEYHHHKTWGDRNGASHLRSMLIGPSLTVPFADGALETGTWQQIVYLDFDEKAQRRTVKCAFLGESRS